MISESIAKPVLKWAGGKTQLLPVIKSNYPKQLGTQIKAYIEPFFGGGAVFFDLYNSRLIDEAILMDTNSDLIVLYKTIQKQPDQLIETLHTLAKKYSALNEREKEIFYYDIRSKFNLNRKEKDVSLNPVRASQIIFMNRTCFNGLFRVNRKGEFNVPYGTQGNPKILDIRNIYAVSKAFGIAEIRQGDFEDLRSFIKKDTFIYYDPPYKPLNKTSHFNAYSGVFSDADQTRLAKIYTQLHKKNIKVYQMLSNSDPLNATGDNFFDTLYDEFNILRVEAKRRINSNASRRGKIYELLIMNYTHRK